MRVIKLTLILSLLITQMSCIERRTNKSNLDAKLIESMEGPRVIRDTIIQVVLLDTVDTRNDIAQIDEPKAPVRPTRTVASSNYRNDNDIDRGNSGFFDQYRSNYGGDPNKGISNTPTTRTVRTNAEDIERKKEAIERSLNVLEDRNQQEQQRYEQLERERQAFNKKSVQDAKEQQKRQSQQKQQPRSKTLDTNLLLKK